METRQSEIGKMEAQLKQWGAKLDALVAKADEAGAEARDDYRNRVQDLKEKHRAAQAKLDELKAAGQDKWEALKTGAASAWNELEAAFKKLKN